jgi:hypothetical protein
VFNLLNKLRNCHRRSKNQPQVVARQLSCEALEDRTTPTVSSISANFNATAIHAGDYIWFTNVEKVSGLGSSPVTLDVTDQTISFTAKGTSYSLAVPDSTIVFNPATSKASTSFGSGGWAVSSPTSFNGSEFVSGLGWQAGNGLPAGIKNVTWSADFTTSTPGITVNWKWSAAVYSEFTSNMAGIQVKTVPDKKQDVIKNGDRAGTPENFKSDVVAGARGQGGSDWTGNRTSVATVQLNVATGTAVISGTVQLVIGGDSSGGVAGDTVTLMNSSGVQVASTISDANGNYSFGSLAAGTYTVTLFDSNINGGSETLSVTVTDGQNSSGNNFSVI